MCGRAGVPEERSGEATEEGAVEGPGLKGSQRKVADWPHVAGSESLKRVQERLSVKVQFNCSRRPEQFGDASSVG